MYAVFVRKFLLRDTSKRIAFFDLAHRSGRQTDMANPTITNHRVFYVLLMSSNVKVFRIYTGWVIALVKY